MTSWRQLSDSSEWLTWVDLIDHRTNEPREINVTIESVKGGEVTGEGGKKSRKPVLRYRGAKKPHAIGATIGKVITSIAGTDQIERWPGVRITLFVTTTRAKSGETVNCIRVKPVAPKRGASDDPMPEGPPPAEAIAQQAHERQQHVEREPGSDG